MHFGDTLLKLRKQKNISQDELAEKIGVTRQTISNWELNITVPNINDLKKLSEVFGVSYNELLNPNVSENKKISDVEKAAKIILLLFKITCISAVISIVILMILFIVRKINYEKNNIVGSYSLTCTYRDSTYHYNVNYNKKNKIVNATIEGSVPESDKNIQWIADLDSFVFSKKITNQYDLKDYIIDKYEQNNGSCH